MRMRRLSRRHVQVAPGRQGVLLVNTGTPDELSPRAIKDYLGRFLMDDRIRPMARLPWWLILHFGILPKRVDANMEKYGSIWTPEGSPFTLAHKRLARMLQARYAEVGADVVVRHAMSYSSPLVADALADLAAAGCERIVVLPLYPQTAFSTAGAVSDAVGRAKRRLGRAVEVTVADGYHDDRAYIEAIACSIERAGFDVSKGDRLIFSFHSIPLVDIEAGDTYELQVGASCLAIAERLGLERRSWTIGYQCQFDKGRTWLSPFTAQILARWAEQDFEGRVFVVSPNFAVDCLETLYDVEQVMRGEYDRARHEHHKRVRGAHGAEVAGDEAGSFVYVPCLNDSADHVDVLAHVLAPYLGEPHGEDR